MHDIDEIIKNQREFYNEIFGFLKKDLKETKEMLAEIKSQSETIVNLKEQLQKKVNKFKLIPEIEKYFITKENPNPHYYAIWDDESQEAKIFKFNNEERKKEY